MREAPRLNENVNENIVDKSAQARKIADLFKKGFSSATHEHMLKITLAYVLSFFLIQQKINLATLSAIINA